MLNITVKLFGGFRKYGNGEEISFSVPENIKVSELKKYLENEISKTNLAVDKNLIEASVFGNEDEILTAEKTITKDCTLAVLPPVCGG